MSFETHRASLYQFMIDNWQPPKPPVRYDNNETPADQANAEEYVAMTINNGDTISHIGCNRFVGEVVFQVVTAHNTGEKAARQYADQLFALFHNVEHETVFYGPVSVHRVGNAEGVFIINVNVPFKYDA